MVWFKPTRSGLHQHTRPHLSAWVIYWVWASHCLGSLVFLPINWRQIIIQPSSTLDGLMDMRTNRYHYSSVHFKQPIGRNRWPSCWHGSYGIIYNPPQSPQPSVDLHRVINTNDIHLLLWLNTETPKTTPWVDIRFRGYDDMTQQILLV